MTQAIPFLLPFLVPLLAWFGLTQGGPWVLAGWLFVFIAHPILDFLAGNENPNRTATETATATASVPYHSLLLWLYVPYQAAFLSYALWWAATRNPTPLELLGATLSIGSITGGLGITIAHELVHRRRRAERGLGVL